MPTSSQLTRGRRPTQADVARLAGVSQAMVSYIVSETTTVVVPDATRQRILTAIAELGYVPDRAARSLRTRKTLTLACIIPDIINPFYPAFQRGIQDAADHLGYDVLTYNTDGDPEKEARCLRSVQQGRVDGVVAVLFHQTAVALRDLLDRGIAVVRFEAGRKEAGPWPIDNLYVDNAAAARAVITHLIQRGHSRIGVITGRKGPRPARLLGYLRALTEYGIEPDDRLVREGDFQEREARLAMRELLALASPPTAIFAVNDLMAIGALVAIREAGLRVPDEIAVAGFDDIPAAQFVSPALTTIAQHPERLGRRAAEMLLERLNGAAPDHGRSEEMPYELI
ncbi:MAG: LacI family DNA-binding transcriptional regulator, partial [Thermomicrobiales bacterium]